VHAKENPEGNVPKTLGLDDITVTPGEGTGKQVHVAAYDGAVSRKDVNSDGDPTYDRLRCVQIQRHENRTGFRWYGYYELPEDVGGTVISLSLHQTKEDRRRRVNRTENLRPIPEGTVDFARLHVLRPDAESINRGIEDSLFINRATAKGWRRQLVDLLGHARLINAITLARCRARAVLTSVA